jgi:acyl carrier protein
MDETAIYARLTEIFHDVFDDESIVLTPETTASDIAAWDSFNHMNISVASEAAFGIRFKASELEDLRNVGELVDIIKQKLH